LYPTRNLDNVADDCKGINHLTQFEERRLDIVLKNSFGFGGVNSALVLARFNGAQAFLPVVGMKDTGRNACAPLEKE